MKSWLTLIKLLESNNLPECGVRKQKVLVPMLGYYVVDGVLYFESVDVPDSRLVVPTHLHQCIVDKHHDPVFAGHFSAKKPLGKLKRLYYWHGMRPDVHQKCSSCVM